MTKHITDYVNFMHGKLEGFLNHWADKNNEDHPNYPMEFDSFAEWDEQFQAYLDIHETNIL